MTICVPPVIKQSKYQSIFTNNLLKACQQKVLTKVLRSVWVVIVGWCSFDVSSEET